MVQGHIIVQGGIFLKINSSTVSNNSTGQKILRKTYSIVLLVAWSTLYQLNMTHFNEEETKVNRIYS